MKYLAILLIFFLVAQTSAAGQQTDQLAKVKADVQKRGTGEHSRVKVALHDKSEHQGRITQVGESSFSLTEQKSGQVISIAYVDVESVRGPGLSTGAKIAIVAGVGVGVVVVVVVAALHSCNKKCI
jgi:hypothetical protein